MDRYKWTDIKTDKLWKYFNGFSTNLWFPSANECCQEF